MKKGIVLLMVLVLAVAFAAVAPAESSSPAYTFMLTDLGQGAGGGGALNADYSARGHAVVSAQNGEVIAHLYPDSWSEVVPGQSVDICFDIVQTKGPPIFPNYVCLSWLGIVVPVSDMPVLITNPMGGGDLLIKATPAG